MSNTLHHKRRNNPAAGLKGLISASALAITLIGWGLLGRQALQTGSPDQPADLGSIVRQILGDLPTLLSRAGIAPAARRSTLRSVNLNTQSSSSRGFPVTRTQSSR
jgi:hypothetical protein